MRRRASCLFLLAAILWWGGLSALAIRPDSLENRVEGCEPFASGQASAAASQTVENAVGCGGCGYETASGQARFLNRDPIGEAGGINLYGFVGNSPLNTVDPYGLAPWYSWLNPFNYSTAFANWQGQNAIQAQLARANYNGQLGYSSLDEFNLAHRNFQGDFTSGDTDTVRAAATFASESANLYLTVITSVTPTAGGTRCVARLTQQGLEHIAERHLFTTGAQDAGKFAEGIGAREIRDMISETVTQGSVRPNTLGRAGQIFEYDFGQTIGVDINGNATSQMRVVVGPDQTVKTAFPY